MKIKKILLFILGLLLFFTLASCNNNTSTTNPDDTKEPDTPGTTDPVTPSTPTRDVAYPTAYPDYTEDSLMIHYQRKDNKYKPWSLWVWLPSKDGKQYNFNYMDDFGVIAYYKLSEIGAQSDGRIGFIVAQLPGWGAKDVDSDRYIDLSSYTKDSKSIFHIYLFTGDPNMYSNADKSQSDGISKASFESRTSIALETTNEISHYTIYKNDQVVTEDDVDNLKSTRINLDSDKKFEFGNNYSIKVKFVKSKEEMTSFIAFTKLYDQAFDEEYYYDGELGAIYTSTSTTFKVWSPVSTRIDVIVYESGTPKALNATLGNDTIVETKTMTKGTKGVFTATINGNLEGKYYTYKVFNCNNPNGAEVVDPYAKSAGINGSRGMIVDFSKTNPENWNSVTPLQIDRKALTVYELHVADLTSSATWGGTEANAKKFLGLQESGTTYTKNGKTVTTGFDHIKELGVNAVQLLPIFDQANDEVNPTFNWGYNPLNYNCLEGSYSSDAYDGYARIKEFKQVVKAYNEAGINIIMDVVYNHTNSVAGTNFDVLMPGYYFRYNADGNLYNGSGCGNETASEHLMFRKFMIDSTTFWMEEYKLGGFRFDLMGLHDTTTMAKIVEECEKINPKATIYGEPWTGGTSGLAAKDQAIQNNHQSYVGYGCFNDKFRDELVKGGLSAASDLSWISSTKYNMSALDVIEAGFKGTAKLSLSTIPVDKTVNYATCHDNYTLYDRFKAAGIQDNATLKKMAMLANAMVFTSNGTTFILSGEEFLRTKAGNSNSYNASYKINELNYALKIDNYDMFENYKKLISFKQSCKGLQVSDTATITVNQYNAGNTFEIIVRDETNHKEYHIIHNNGILKGQKSFDLSSETLYLDTLGLHTEGLGTEVTLEVYETIITYKQI